MSSTIFDTYVVFSTFIKLYFDEQALTTLAYSIVSSENDELIDKFNSFLLDYAARIDEFVSSLVDVPHLTI